MRRITAASVCSLIVSCAAEPSVAPIVGPDGTPMFHVSCRGHESRCYQLAGERCPAGYDLSRTHSDRESFLLRCRGPGRAALPSSWAPGPNLAPAPYSSTAAPYPTAVPVTTAPPGYPPLGSGMQPLPKDDVGY